MNILKVKYEKRDLVKFRNQNNYITFFGGI